MPRLARYCCVVVIVAVVLSGGVGAPVLAATGGATTTDDLSYPTVSLQQSADNTSVRQLATSLRDSQFGAIAQGKQINVQVTQPDGSTDTTGFKIASDGSITVVDGGYSDPALTTHLAESTLESIVASPEPVTALEKAIKYDLVSFSASGPGTGVVTSLTTESTSLSGRARIASANIDIDDDPQTDAILEIEARDSDGDAEFDRLVRTVLRDIDDDGVMDTVTSEIRPVASTVSGSVDLDLNDDGTRDTLLQLTGQDTNTDGELDQRTKTTLVDTKGDPQFDRFTEARTPISPTTSVTGEWDLNNDGTVNARITIEGEHIDDDASFDRQTLTIALNLDDEPGFESTSSTTARINPTLSIAAEFDTDGDGTPDTKASISASDTNGDGGLDSESVSVVNDSDDDGVYDSVVRRDEFRRGFLSNEGEPIAYVDDPQTLTVIGVLASILSMGLQLIQGG